MRIVSYHHIIISPYHHIIISSHYHIITSSYHHIQNPNATFRRILINVPGFGQICTTTGPNPGMFAKTLQKVARDFSHHFLAVSDRFGAFSGHFGPFRSVFLAFRTVSDRFFLCFGSYRIVSDRFELLRHPPRPPTHPPTRGDVRHTFL